MTKVPQWPSRRGVLAAPALAAVAIGVASCGKSKPETGAGAGAAKSSGGHTAVRSASDLARDRAVAAETDLLAQYDAALALPSVTALPTIAAQLRTVRAEHAAHLSAIRQGYAVPPPAGSAAATPSPTPTPTPTPTPVPTPSGTTATSDGTPAPAATGPTTAASATATATATATTDVDPKTTVLALIKAEQAASTRLTADVMSVDGITAQLLASIAAAEAGHAAFILGGVA